MQVNMLEAKSQLSKLVKAALAGQEVVIASHGEAQVRLVPCTPAAGLRHCGIWADRGIGIDAAFSEESDAEVANLFAGT
ncbi:type II toxin-antitoxin system Phd/YefM family antitoxin [Halochromatium roseum]|uniref:type II toxin-antitoxin system Phd/YefM family antitoxin n=1 Tax=Halochromatium roseum TaxID=391920 RepID=UPI001911F8A1|nr:type II toxin-antitoxin system prevent-host-death family antitoxin [Halochromatium roseum]MBK5941209.1 prevent-host-death protein [Halochromatium roseum]